MKRGLKAVLFGALAAALLVPAAGAKPGNGNGHGPPPWAGGGHEGGKPDWASKDAKKAEKAERKAERRAARAGDDETGEDAPKHSNPAWICKFEREQMGEEAFAEEYGENENQANAFGKCVSREAHDRDGVTPDGEETPGEEPTDPADSDGEEPDEPALPANVQAFLHYLWPLLF
jgi:hypothetical protein